MTGTDTEGGSQGEGGVEGEGAVEAGGMVQLRSSPLFWGGAALAFLMVGLGIAAVEPIGLLIAIAYGAWCLSRALSTEPRLSISEDGVDDRMFWTSAGLVRWEEIRDVRPTRWGYVELELFDENPFWERLGPLQRLGRVKQQLAGLGPALVFAWGLRGSTAELVAALEDGLDRYALRAAREGRALPGPGLEAAHDQPLERADQPTRSQVEPEP